MVQNDKIPAPDDGRPPYWKMLETLLPTNGPIWIKFGWLHPIMSPHVRHDAVAMATAVAKQPRIEHLAVMGV